MGTIELAASALRPDGDRLLTPVLGDGDRFAHRIVLEGTFRFAYTGEEFDAVYRAGPGGAFTRRHSYLQWSPRAPVLESEDTVRHRYVFRIPGEWGLEGQSVGVRVDVDRFVNEFLIPPSEVRGALSGEVTMRVLQTALAPPSPWPLIGWSALPGALLAGGVGWVIRRRMAFAGLAPELQARLARIEQQCRAARAALGEKGGRLASLHGRLTAVREGAFTLARQIQSLQDARGRLDPLTVEAEMERLQEQLAAITDETARHEGETALGEKRKTLALLRERDRTAALCEIRLSKIEAVLESTCLTLQSLATGPSTEPAEEALRRELDAEVSAIEEVAQEIMGCERLRRTE